MDILFTSFLDEIKKINILGVWYVVLTILTIYATKWFYRWRNPKCNGILPPGSMGFPFIGETLQLILPSHSLDLPPFLKNRIKKYGQMFKTNVAGRPVIISADSEFNSFILKQDGKLVETWSLDTFAEMTVDFAAKQIFSGDLENAPFNISDMFRDLVEGLMSFPINLPGTSHHKCLKIHKKVRETMRDVLKKRIESSTRKRKGEEDLVDHLLRDMDSHKFLTEDYIVQMMFGLLFVTSDSISTTLALSFKLLVEHPDVLEELIVEHEAILKNKESLDAPLTWNDYKSMTFTLQVINEVLRLGNIAPGLFRRALKDISVNGYTIPAGWVIMIATAALHLNSDQFEDPLSFNPWRWKKIQLNGGAKNFMPFGFGMKQCAGAEYSRVFLATFLHVLVTKYRWTMVKGGKIIRAPIIRFPDGFHFNISKKN
ncbi:beta-amyrin 16-alpha-hydroxylase CYP87D16-like [Solanum dulcamara]|uniref:beta-amyrin 16-alpha-hydroxylase CYP87D16-like n=1 Tax=Solanum dulcamara TaxID=45834 RepID=UPI002486C4AD|nr:beta-amyrin 16-alpha-hydroxylase CYP87D16-like [Solanum dulcamara]